ncbi:MAG: manno-octulosonate cytidylyltransferase [Pseudomonadota bacterium]|nr:manno-octulosonate cytidylyltransferase [Pseudomonadota bacterium]
MDFKPVIIIPARYTSERLPAKALCLIGQKTLIRHVWERAVATKLGPVFVATDHVLIQQEVASWGGQVLMTAQTCPTGSDRVAQACQMIKHDYNVVINIQGDLPFVDPAQVAHVLQPLSQGFDVGTLIANMPIEKRQDPNCVKAIVTHQESSVSRCHWFCRAALPYGAYHVGIYAYTPAALKVYAQHQQSPYEKIERLEQLRFLEMGYQMGASSINQTPLEVNSPQDLEAVILYKENEHTNNT